MRPNFVILIVDQHDSLRDFELYYSAGKCNRALQRFNTPRDGFHYLYREDKTFVGHSVDASNPLTAHQRMLTNFLWTQARPWRRTFINATEAEFEELSEIFRVPVPVLKKIAEYETAFFESVSTMRWDAIKRKFLPRFLYNLI